MLKSISYSVKYVFLSALLLCSTQLLAVTVNVETGGYAGKWRIQGQTAEIVGNSQIDIPAGNYNIIVGTVGSFLITVHENGSVVSYNVGAANGGNNILSFNTIDIHFNPAGFLVQNVGNNNARWGVSRVISEVTTASDVTLVKGIRYLVNIGTHGSFAIILDINGNVTVENSASATVSANTVTFNTVQVTVDPGLFLNQIHAVNNARWAISRVMGEATISGVVNLVPSVRYGVVVGTYGVFFIQLDGHGNVTVENGFSASGGDRVLTFNTLKIFIDPKDFLSQADGGIAAQWGLSRVIGYATESGEVIVVPGIRYGVNVGTYGIFYIQIEQNGDVVVENGYSGVGGSNSLQFNTESILVNPGLYEGRWQISRVVRDVTDEQSVNMVPGVRYQLYAGGQVEYFNVSSPCAVSPANINFDAGSFTLSCGLPDTDDDGVPDNDDNCPAIANPDQVDLDQDNIGDVCDTDIDGDGIDNTLDNCPAFSNVIQSDIDDDGIGDVCDADQDGDSVADEADNCPLMPNPGQGDSDIDGFGDVCDIDDDDDNITDELDNCPLHSNSDQSDFDGNGEGDVCDGDSDGDSVLNDNDICPLSPLDQSVTEDGCSGSQYVELECVRDNFVKHGKYVSCVAHAAKRLVEEGIISSNEKSVYVKEAAKSK